VHFDWITTTARVKRQTAAFAYYAVFTVVVILATIIIMVSYTKVFMAVQRQVKSMLADVLGTSGSRTIFGSSVRSAKNLLRVFNFWSKSA